MFRCGPLKRGHESWGHEQCRRRGPMLTVVQIRALKPAERPYKVADTDGLYLLVQPSGALLWRFRYRYCGIERKLSLGSFPDVSLPQARRRRDEAKAELDDGIDPVEEKRQRRLKAELAAQTTFGLVAEEYIQKMEREGRSPATLKKGALVSRTLGRHREAPNCLSDAARASRRFEACRASRASRNRAQAAIVRRPCLPLRFRYLAH